MTRRKTIAILYHARGTYPLRTAVETHLHAWLRHSRHHAVHVNAALCDPTSALTDLDPDVILIHTSFCGLRWNRDEYDRLEPAFEPIGRMRALKIALPQDEYYLVNALRSMLDRMQAGVILSCAEPENWPVLYGDLAEKARFRTVLTGYLDDRVVEKARLWSKPLRDREIFVSYRAWDTGYWLGEHGSHKVRVGEAMRSALEHRNIPSDISMIASDTIAGGRWLKFLGNSRATIGVEGGASLIDKDGSIKACVDGFTAANPDATLEDVRTACFPEGEGGFKLACLSPRHLEAVATGTVQALVRGGYNGILEADRHYVAIEPDYSNLDHVIDTLKDDEIVTAMTELARRDIVESGRYTYRAFVDEIDEAYVDPLADTAPARPFARMRSAVRDWINWRIIQAECFYLEHPGLFRPFAWLLRPIYCRLVPSSRS